LIAAPMLRPNTIALTLVLSLLTGIAPMSVDMYLASLPDIGRALAAPDSAVQLTLSFYLIGFAIGQVIYGPLSDRHGRRPILLASLALFVAASVVCIFAPTIEVLVTARFIQAIGGSGTVVLARTVVRDIYEGVHVARELSRMAAVMALAPLIAPLMGGALQTYFSWRSNFVVLTGIGLLALALIVFMLQETLRARAPEPVSLPSILRSYRVFVGNGSFLAHCGILVCAFGGLFAWISACAFVLQELYGLSPLAFGLTFAVGSGGYLVGTWIAAFVVARLGLDRTMGLGCLAMAGGGIGAALALVIAPSSAIALMLPVALFLGGLGLALPQAQAGALLPFPERAGAASSLVGFSQQAAGAVVGAVVVHMQGQSGWPLALGMALMGIAALVIWKTTHNIRAAKG
jgi:DHA1 family bicyclomycin/chloramphenicol resistance-like MFS transporter